jgi:hypothetical protein
MTATLSHHLPRKFKFFSWVSIFYILANIQPTENCGLKLNPTKLLTASHFINQMEETKRNNRPDSVNIHFNISINFMESQNNPEILIASRI